jgi:hypothetical protein
MIVAKGMPVEPWLPEHLLAETFAGGGAGTDSPHAHTDEVGAGLARVLGGWVAGGLYYMQRSFLPAPA